MLNLSGRTIKHVIHITSGYEPDFEIIDQHTGEDYKVIKVACTRKNLADSANHPQPVSAGGGRRCFLLSCSTRGVES